MNYPVRIEKGQALMPDFLLPVLVCNVNDSYDILILFSDCFDDYLKKTKCCSREDKMVWLHTQCDLDEAEVLGVTLIFS